MANSNQMADLSYNADSFIFAVFVGESRIVVVGRIRNNLNVLIAWMIIIVVTLLSSWYEANIDMPLGR